MFVELMPLPKERTLLIVAGDCRPAADSRLKGVPYWNTDAHGRVCLGSMRVPGEVSVASLSGWEDAYFASGFTHPSGTVRLTNHPGGFLGLWSSLAGKKHKFPGKVLGEPRNRRNRRHRLRLRTVSELFPEVAQSDLDPDGLPSCSAAEALDR